MKKNEKASPDTVASTRKAKPPKEPKPAAPPARVFVSVDLHGPHRAARTLKGAKAEAEADLFGTTHIYEYALVEKKPKATVENVEF